uniref:BLE2 protein n=1 Tax=Oryza nivara TaxID=4536 RepID=A0A0E0I502_ORYNI
MVSPTTAEATRRWCKAAAAAASAAPEKHLNRFVRLIAFIERAGNGIGTLVFTWATVVILGGFSTMVTTREFLSATFLAFLEATRMFSQNSRLEYQFFFRTRGAFRRPRWNRVVLILCMAEIMVYVVEKFQWSPASYSHQHYGPVRVTTLGIMGMTMCVFVLMKNVCPPILNLFCDPQVQLRAISLWSPLAVILLSAPSLFLEKSAPVAKEIFTFLLTAVIVVTISRLQFQWITSLVNGPVVRKMLFLRPVILFLCTGAAIVIFGYRSWHGLGFIVFFLIFALVLESFGNLQIPAAVARVVIAMVQPTTLICVDNVQTFAKAVVKILFYTQAGEYEPLDIPTSCNWAGERNYSDGTTEDTKKNIMFSLNIFYVIVLIQGALYIVACVLEIFSFILRIILVHQSRFRRPWGMKCINQYYSYIFEQCISGGVLSKTNMELTSFAMDLTDSDSPSNQLDGVRMLHSFLKRKNTKALLLFRLSTSTKTLERSISMLGWTAPEDAEIRLLAAKVVIELARSLQVIAIPGSMQNISSLLDTDNQLRQRSPLLYTYDSQEERQGTIADTGNGQEHLDQDHLLHNNQENSWILGCWELISKCWSIPKEETFIEQDRLPLLGMSILARLANCDPNNCVEIGRARDLIPKIIGYTDGTQPKILKGSSLKLLGRLSNTGGEIAGQALAMLAMESVNNCSTMLKEAGNAFIRELTVMIQDDKYKYVSASLLQNLCLHAQSKFSSSDLTELSGSLRQVLHGITDTTVATKLEVLIGLSSQICHVIPEDFAIELEHDQIKETFVKKLVEALNSNTKPTAQCPRIRRVIVEQVIYMMESNSSYATCFDECQMMQALSMVEATPSKVENYRLFMGNEGLMEYSIPLSNLVARAKEEIMHHVK